jgi:hypothetical protein
VLNIIILIKIKWQSLYFFSCSFFFTWKVHRPPSSTIAHRQTLLLRPSTGDPPSTSNWLPLPLPTSNQKLKQALQINTSDAAVPPPLICRHQNPLVEQDNGRRYYDGRRRSTRGGTEAARRSIEGGGGWSGRRKLLILFCRLCCSGFFFKQECGHVAKWDTLDWSNGLLLLKVT